MRVLDCECAETLQAANDDDLRRVVAEHLELAHGGQPPSDEEVAELVSKRAYDATDS
jgi:hypothetical protein